MSAWLPGSGVMRNCKGVTTQLTGSPDRAVPSLNSVKPGVTPPLSAMPNNWPIDFGFSAMPGNLPISFGLTYLRTCSGSRALRALASARAWNMAAGLGPRGDLQNGRFFYGPDGATKRGRLV